MASNDNLAITKQPLVSPRGPIAKVHHVLHSIYIWVVVIPLLVGIIPAGYLFLHKHLWPTDDPRLGWLSVSVILFATIMVLSIVLAYFARSAIRYKSIFAASKIGQIRYKEFYDWMRAAVGLLDHGGRSDFSGTLIDTFLRTYAVEDARQLQGHSTAARKDVTHPGNRIYTSFVSYSNLVKSVVEAATASPHPEHKDSLAFLTTLRMPLTQWFNHKTDRLSPNFPYLETDENWVNYLEYMFDLRKASGKYHLYRVLQACTDCGVGEHFPIIGEEKLWRLAQGRILLEANGDKVDYERFPRPFTNVEINAIISSTPPFAPLRQFLKDNYSGRSLAYLITPESEDTFVIEGYKWVPVGEAFHNFFCDGVYEDRCYVARLTMSQLETWHQSLDSIPNDIFLSGIRVGEGEFNWLLSLGATTDDDCQMVRLEFGTPDLNNARIAVMQRNLSELMHAARRPRDFIVPLSDWLKTPPRENRGEAKA